MENFGEQEQQLSMSLTSSSHLSNGSTDNNKLLGGQEARCDVDIMSLNKLSSNLEKMLSDSSTDFSDAEIVIENSTLSVHRCILASRSTFFREYFRTNKGFVVKDGKARYYMREILPFGKVGYDAFLVLVSYLYTGKLKPSPLEMCTCVDNLCTHEACRPAIDFAVELMYASTIFQVSELASLYQRCLLSLVDKATVEDVIPILVAAFHCHLNQILTKCVNKVAQSKLENSNIEKEVPPTVAEDIKQFRLNSQPKEEADAFVDPLREKGINRILKALDSEDVELVRLLLNESDITLDEAYALHYAVAYCDPKTVSELLNLGIADVNLRNSQGKTVIHVAARRKEPSIIVSLLSKGARVSETTLGGRTALIICKRLTRPKDFHMTRERGQEGNRDRICIDVLERELLRDPFGKDASITSPEMVDDLQMKLIYLEDRVAFARMFFPTEAKLAMEIAHAETTSDLAGFMASRHSSGNLREVDLNETPLTQNKRLLLRIETLSRTVELGRRYFPHCSEVLDRFMEDDLPDAFFLEKGTVEEQKIKRERFMELKDEFNKAFNKDKEKLHRSGFSAAAAAASSSSPRSSKIRIGRKARKL